jgi:DNA-binding NarL/FixJ family response regulator
VARIRVFLADDHDAILAGIAELLADEFEVVGTARSGLELLVAVERCVPDVVVVDITMPELSGIDATSRLLERDPELRVVILTVHNEAELVSRALEAGALGYVVKMRAGEDLIPAIRAAVLGRSFVSPCGT